MENYCRKMAWLLYNRGLVDKKMLRSALFARTYFDTGYNDHISLYNWSIIYGCTEYLDYLCLFL